MEGKVFDGIIISLGNDFQSLSGKKSVVNQNFRLFIDLEKNSPAPGKRFQLFWADQLKLLSRFWEKFLSPEFF